MTILTELGIAAAAKGLRGRQFSARELTQAHVSAIEALDGQLNAFITPTPALALDAADQADAALSRGDAGA